MVRATPRLLTPPAAAAGRPPAARAGARVAAGRRAPAPEAPAREGAEIRLPDGPTVGTVTSGGFAPSLGAPIAMGYVAAEHAAAGTKLNLVVRGKDLPAEVVDMPFVPHRYYRKPKTS